MKFNPPLPETYSSSVLNTYWACLGIRFSCTLFRCIYELAADDVRQVRTVLSKEYSFICSGQLCGLLWYTGDLADMFLIYERHEGTLFLASFLREERKNELNGP